MNSIVSAILKITKKVSYFGMEYFHITLNWIMKLGKIQGQFFRKGGARKQVLRNLGSLGDEIYTFYKSGGNAGWLDQPQIRQQLDQVGEAEAKILQADAEIDAIDAAFKSKKQEISEKYAAKRSSLDVEGPTGGGE
jgi:hypothetical protein